MVGVEKIEMSNDREAIKKDTIKNLKDLKTKIMATRNIKTVDLEKDRWEIDYKDIRTNAIVFITSSENEFNTLIKGCNFNESKKKDIYKTYDILSGNLKKDIENLKVLWILWPFGYRDAMKNDIKTKIMSAKNTVTKRLLVEVEKYTKEQQLKKEQALIMWENVDSYLWSLTLLDREVLLKNKNFQTIIQVMEKNINDKLPVDIKKMELDLSKKNNVLTANYLKFLIRTAKQYGITPMVLISIAYQESRFKKHAFNSLDGWSWVFQMTWDTPRMIIGLQRWFTNMFNQREWKKRNKQKVFEKIYWDQIAVNIWKNFCDIIKKTGKENDITTNNLKRNPVVSAIWAWFLLKRKWSTTISDNSVTFTDYNQHNAIRKYNGSWKRAETYASNVEKSIEKFNIS